MSYASFIYDNINIITSDVEGGGYVNNSGVWTEPGAEPPTAVNPEHVIDEKIDKSCLLSSGEIEVGSYKAGLKILCDGQKTVNLLAIYLPSAVSNTIARLYQSNSENSEFTSVVSITTLVAGWNVILCTELTAQYYVLQLESSSAFINVPINELLIGGQYIFTHRFRKGGVRQKERDNLIESSTPGVEYVTKIGSKAKIWKDSVGGLSTAETADILAFDDAVEGSFRKFLFSEDGVVGPYWWVRADDGSFEPKNHGGISSVSFTLRQQLI